VSSRLRTALFSPQTNQQAKLKSEMKTRSNCFLPASQNKAKNTIALQWYNTQQSTRTIHNDWHLIKIISIQKAGQSDPWEGEDQSKSTQNMDIRAGRQSQKTVIIIIFQIFKMTKRQKILTKKKDPN
jgi:hypothetical protein